MSKKIAKPDERGFCTLKVKSSRTGISEIVKATSITSMKELKPNLFEIKFHESDARHVMKFFK